MLPRHGQGPSGLHWQAPEGPPDFAQVAHRPEQQRLGRAGEDLASIQCTTSLHVLLCVVHDNCTCVAVAWRDYDGEDLLQNLPVRNPADSSFKLSPLWVYLFTHVSPLLCAL